MLPEMYVQEDLRHLSPDLPMVPGTWYSSDATGLRILALVNSYHSRYTMDHWYSRIVRISPDLPMYGTWYSSDATGLPILALVNSYRSRYTIIDYW